MKIFILILLIFLSSCSKLNFAYEFAPKYVTDSLDENFDFTSERYNKIREALIVDFKNNKLILRAEVIQQIEKLQVLSESQELTEKQIKDYIVGVKEAQKKLTELFKPTIEVVVSDLNAKEFANMKKKSEERFQKIDERLSDKKKYKEKAFDSFEKNMEKLFDSVSVEQKKIYENFIDENFDFYRDQFDFRKSALLKFESLLDKKPEFLDYAFKFYMADDSIKSAEFLKKQEAYQHNMYVTAVKLWKSLSDEQRTELKKMLAELKDEVSTLK